MDSQDALPPTDVVKVRPRSGAEPIRLAIKRTRIVTQPMADVVSMDSQ